MRKDLVLIWEDQNASVEWRRTRKNRRDPIPARLWKTAVKLAGSNAIHSISKALRLNYSDPKERNDRIFPISYEAARIIGGLKICMPKNFQGDPFSEITLFLKGYNLSISLFSAG